MVDHHYYITGIDIQQNNGNPLKVSGIDYHGRRYEGTFDRDCIQDGMLEVRVISFVENTEWAWVKPVSGSFHDEKGASRDEGIPVKKVDIRGIVK